MLRVYKSTGYIICFAVSRETHEDFSERFYISQQYDDLEVQDGDRENGNTISFPSFHCSGF